MPYLHIYLYKLVFCDLRRFYTFMVYFMDIVIKMDYRVFYTVVFRIWSFYMMVLCYDISFICMTVSCLFLWFLFEIIVVSCGFIMCFCYGYFRFLLWICCDISILFFVWLNYNLLAIDLFLSDHGIIFCDNSIIFCGLLWFIMVYCELFLDDIIVCNALFYKCLWVFSVMPYVVVL